MANGLNKRPCKQCSEVFQKIRPLDMFCSVICASRYRYQKEMNKPKKAIKKESAKRTTQKKIYKILRKAYLLKNPICEVEGCCEKANEIHHKNGREGERLNDTRYFFATHRECHNKIHLNPKWARENGYLI